MTICCISGKARHGKDTFAGFLRDALERRGYRVLIFHYADLLKYLATQYFGWNGVKDDTGRTLLQWLGTDTVRERDPEFWVDFAVRMFKVFHTEWDYILIPDCRFPNEIDKMKTDMGLFCKVLTMRIDRGINFDNGLSEEQKNHPSETALDDYDFDYYIHNHLDLEDFQMMAEGVFESIIDLKMV